MIGFRHEDSLLSEYVFFLLQSFSIIFQILSFHAAARNDTYEINPWDNDYDYSYFDNQVDTIPEVFDYITAWAASKDDDYKFQLGHQLDDLILDCIYNKYPCNATL